MIVFYSSTQLLTVFIWIYIFFNYRLIKFFLWIYIVYFIYILSSKITYLQLPKKICTLSDKKIPQIDRTFKKSENIVGLTPQNTCNIHYTKLIVFVAKICFSIGVQPILPGIRTYLQIKVCFLYVPSFSNVE